MGSHPETHRCCMALLTELRSQPYILIQNELNEISVDMNMLSETELARHDRFIDVKKRAEFLAGRCMIKQVLGKVLGKAPETIVLPLTNNGKPYCEQEGEEQVHFNLAHGSGYFVLALSLNSIGVDIERKREMVLDVMQPILSALEAGLVSELPIAEQSEQILKLFTAKEAFIKATDKKYGLDEIEFLLQDSEWVLRSPEHDVSIEHIENREILIAISVDLE